jgi:hypothetical protein
MSFKSEADFFSHLADNFHVDNYNYHRNRKFDNYNNKLPSKSSSVINANAFINNINQQYANQELNLDDISRFNDLYDALTLDEGEPHTVGYQYNEACDDDSNEDEDEDEDDEEGEEGEIQGLESNTLFVDSNNCHNHQSLSKTKETPAAQMCYTSVRPNTRVPGDNGYKDFVFQMTIMDMQV